MGTLDGKLALVTGGGRGIGRAIALALAGAGAAVVVMAGYSKLDAVAMRSNASGGYGWRGLRLADSGSVAQILGSARHRPSYMVNTRHHRKRQVRRYRRRQMEADRVNAAPVFCCRGRAGYDRAARPE